MGKRGVVKVRLAGINCPEKDQPFGKKAKKLTSRLALGQVVTAKVLTTDKHGRTIAYVILPGGRNLNHKLIISGLAWWYTSYAPDDRVLAELQAEAREAKRGLWASRIRIPPWEWRKNKNGKTKSK
jgi:endonuclease YncB( thermonuclease family)